MTTSHPNRCSELQHLSAEPHEARAFYETLFGWPSTTREVPGQGPRIEVAGTEGGPMASFMRPRESEPARWVLFFEVADLAATLAKIAELGGKLLQGPVVIPHNGSLAVVADPLGAVFKLWQPEVAAAR